ncbi:MAG: prepilin-type N-terminal cleavage/methylation domain-containing protein [Syntrophomonadaceae bacterium]|nr:prepilin-type N-terminal cleavage/methylation domain-containing protein [Syntrophomonadaceae bacterium]
MGKRYNQFRFHSESGFTLVEIMAAMVILLLIVTACFPLFTMATKTTHENRARLTANELAKRELERVLAQVTPSNYVSEDDDPDIAPLKTGISATYYFDNNGDPIDTRDDSSRFARFEACKIVQWIDDDADGVHPADKFPFDYKVLIIEVSSPSLFTGKVNKQADFKTFVAREGTASPITGVIVEVVRGWTDDAGERIPLEGAQVSLTGVGPTHNAMTNVDGQALIPMTFPDDSTVYSYAIQTEYSGMIMRPDQKAGVPVEARPYTTNSVTVEMEEPATLTLRFAPAKNDIDITLNGLGGPFVETLIAGQNSVTFTDLWPTGSDPDHPGRGCAGGNYSLDVPPLLAYSKLPPTGLKHPVDVPNDPDDPDDHAVLNLWNYIDPYDNNDGIPDASDTTPAWVASDDYLAAGDEIDSADKHRLAFLKSDSTEPEIIVLKPFEPLLAGVTARLTASFTELALSEYNSLADGFILVYLGKEDAELNSDDSDDWTPFIKIGTDSVSGKRVILDENDDTLKTETDDHKIIIPPTDMELGLKNAYFSEPFKMRFDSNHDIGTFYFRKINIHCTYDNFPSIDFTRPGDHRSLHISG